MHIRNVLCPSWAKLAMATWMGLVAGVGASASHTDAAEPQQSGGDARSGTEFRMYDDFDGKLALEWEPVRHDPTHVSLTKHPGKLTITTQRGTIHGNEKGDELSEGTQAKNLYLIRNPAKQDGDFVMTTRIESFAPTTNWQQAGLMIYDDDDNYVKCDLEWNRQAPSQVVPVFLRETGQQSDFFSAMPKESKSYWLRVMKRGKLYQFAYSIDGDSYIVVGEKAWGNGTPKCTGIFAKNGGNPLAADIDAQFDFFEVRSLTEDEKNDPLHLERQKLQGVWEVTSFQISGKPVDDAPLSQFAFDHGQLTIEEKTRSLVTEYALDIAKNPRQLVISALDTRQPRPVRAIYSLTRDTLRICFDPRAGTTLPTELETKQGDGRILITLDRAKKNDRTNPPGTATEN